MAFKFAMSAVLRNILIGLLPPLVTRLLRYSRRQWATRSGLGASDAPAPMTTASGDRRYWGLHDLDRKIEKYLDFDGGYYVELGANNGRLASNTLYFETRRGWSGLLIEPAPNLYLECIANRSESNKIVCAACVSFDYQADFVKIIYSDSMSTAVGVESDIEDGVTHAELGRQFLKPGETVFVFGALARTLQSILVEIDAKPRIDFLSLDVEGAEIEVLKGVDHNVYRFDKMLIECRDFVKLEKYLNQKNYKFIERFNDHDYLFSDVGPGCTSLPLSASAGHS